MDIASRLASLRSRIDAACARAGRSPAEVTLVGVTKRHPASVVDEAFAAGIVDVGENYMQELVEKHDVVASPVRWHFIGHLQRNKVRQIARFVHMIHGVDSERLGREIGRQALACGRTIPVLLQVNTSGEISKYGVDPPEAIELGRALATIDGIELVGLMTLAAFLDDAEGTRPMFRMLRSLRDELREATGRQLEHLSMGMTGDFEVAVEEGATFVRIGTALFGERT
jgi:pyridoxal phosphate enzyme (YggS family)